MIVDPDSETSITDSELVERVLAGASEIFEVLIRRYNRRLYRVTRAILQNDDEAEDVMQEAYVRAFTHLHEFEGRALFSTWLTRIAVHEALSRKKRHSREAPLEVALPSRPVESGTGEQEADVLRDELKHVLEAAIRALPERYRLVFVMRHIEEMSTAETARCLDISEQTVKIRLVRARNFLRRRISADVAGITDLFPFLGDRCDRVTADVVTRIRQTATVQKMTAR